MIYADGSFLEVLTFPLIAGTASLHKPQTLSDILKVLPKNILGETMQSVK
ncbi:MAG: hypothetical protein WKG06_14565 [Segetibacter sp.]